MTNVLSSAHQLATLPMPKTNIGSWRRHYMGWGVLPITGTTCSQKYSPRLISNLLPMTPACTQVSSTLETTTIPLESFA
jgi:hypothetical protein